MREAAVPVWARCGTSRRIHLLHGFRRNQGGFGKDLLSCPRTRSWSYGRRDLPIPPYLYYTTPVSRMGQVGSQFGCKCNGIGNFPGKNLGTGSQEESKGSPGYRLGSWGPLSGATGPPTRQRRRTQLRLSGIRVGTGEGARWAPIASYILSPDGNLAGFPRSCPMCELWKHTGLPRGNFHHSIITYYSLYTYTPPIRVPSGTISVTCGYLSDSAQVPSL